MHSNLEFAKNLLLAQDYTCVLHNGKDTLTSNERGVKPLLQWLESGQDMTDFCAADKVIGKGAAFLYVLLGIKQVYATVISESAKHVLEKNGIALEYDTLVDRIMNRTRTGFCPIETAVVEIEDANEALMVIKATFRELAGK